MKYHLIKGMSLIELMVSLTIGLFLISAFLGLYLAQTQTYRTGVGQGAILNAENALHELVNPLIRGSGFFGCSSVVNAMSNLGTSTALPLGALNTKAAMVMGYNANTNLTAFNAPNASSAGLWTPALESGLVGQVESGSDVLVVLGPLVNASPISVTSIPTGSVSFSVQNASGVASGQYGAISDCAKASIFKITGVSGNTIAHATGGAMGNISDALAVDFPIGAQFIPIVQTAFFVAQGQNNQSVLMRATYNGSGWITEPLIPGIDMMHVLYGIKIGSTNRYVTANNVNDWSQVSSVQLSFLIGGQAGSGSSNTSNPTQFNMLNTTYTIPRDNRLRHVYEMTIYLRNSLL